MMKIMTHTGATVNQPSFEEKIGCDNESCTIE